MLVLRRVLLLLALLTAPLWAEEQRVHIFYIEPQLEMKLSSAAQRGGLPLPLLRVGVARVHGRMYAQMHFKAAGAPREVVQREAAILARRAFKLFPEMEQVDLVGVDRLQFKKPLGKPVVYFSASIRRKRFLAQPPTWSPGQLVNSVGQAYYSPDCVVSHPPAERLQDAASLAWHRSRPPANRISPSATRKPAAR